MDRFSPDVIRIRSLKQKDIHVSVPGSKSHTLRGIVTGSLGKGRTVLRNALLCTDTEVMAGALSLLGIEIQYFQSSFFIKGCEGHIRDTRLPLYMGNSGAPLRFLTSLSALGLGRYTITGTHRMRHRPIQDLLDGLKEWGVKGYTLHNDGFPPLVVEGNGWIKGGKTEVKGNQSSQFLSSMLLVAPYARTDVEIKVNGNLSSNPYVALTLSVMEDFGVKVKRGKDLTFEVSSGQSPYKGRDYQVEGDWSSASFFLP